jgi:hypothetical protein
MLSTAGRTRVTGGLAGRDCEVGTDARLGEVEQVLPLRLVQLQGPR